MRLPCTVLLLGLALSARADDRCLTGDRQLGDQRALATLRTTVEAACPCATAASHRAYQKCARDRIKAAIGGDTLRSACQTTARAVYAASTCGSSGRIACGRIDRNGGASCRIKSARACRNQRSSAEHACGAALTHCADVVDWTAGTCIDVRKPGPFPIGVRRITYTKNAFQPPNGPRALETYVWYPATAAAGDTTAGGTLDAPIAPQGPFPLLMFSHGSCGYATQSLFLTPLLASYGFIVASPPHPGNTIVDFPTCGTGPAQAASFFERPRDIIYVMDQLLAANQDVGSPFYGAVDATRLGMSGHSFGGLTTYLATDLDDRFTAAMPMAPAVSATLTLHIPSMTLTGAVDSVVNNPATRTVFDAADPPKDWVSVGHAGHYAFSDACFAGPDCNPPTTLTQAEAHALVLRYAVPFLRVALAGDATYQPFLDAPAPPGLVHESAR